MDFGTFAGTRLFAQFMCSLPEMRFSFLLLRFQFCGLDFRHLEPDVDGPSWSSGYSAVSSKNASPMRHVVVPSVESSAQSGLSISSSSGAVDVCSCAATCAADGAAGLFFLDD